MNCNKDNLPMKEYFSERMKIIMMRSRTKEELVIMEAMGLGDDHDRKFKSK